jgi:predicted O-methyltransferase YrrM
MIDEAAYLYRLVHSLQEPLVVEIGRYHGGTTFLLAAAGGRVTSLDINPALVDTDVLLERALERYGLSDRVTVEIADSHAYRVEAEAYDVVFVDGDHTYEGARGDVERWLPGITPGGHLILHDAFRPTPERAWARPWKVEGVHRLREELMAVPNLDLVGRAGTLAHFVKQRPDIVLEIASLSARVVRDCHRGVYSEGRGWDRSEGRFIRYALAVLVRAPQLLVATLGRRGEMRQTRGSPADAC